MEAPILFLWAWRLSWEGFGEDLGRILGRIFWRFICRSPCGLLAKKLQKIRVAEIRTQKSRQDPHEKSAHEIRTKNPHIGQSQGEAAQGTGYEGTS